MRPRDGRSRLHSSASRGSETLYFRGDRLPRIIYPVDKYTIMLSRSRARARTETADRPAIRETRARAAAAFRSFNEPSERIRKSRHAAFETLAAKSRRASRSSLLNI